VRRIALTVLVLIVFMGTVLVLGAAPAMSSASAVVAPVARLKTPGFGYVLTRRDFQALYYWQVEKRAGGKIRCTGTCAKLWPPLLVRSAAAVPKTVAGITGRFGVIRRSDGRLQVTRNGLAVYTYAHEGPRQVLCNNVDGWFVVRV
jgi:predicted lipoprotein with Yx(FWY)xxD motif